jgi:hypothetical protein
VLEIETVPRIQIETISMGLKVQYWGNSCGPQPEINRWWVNWKWPYLEDRCMRDQEHPHFQLLTYLGMHMDIF